LSQHVGKISQLLEKYPNNDSILVGMIQIMKKKPELLAENLPKLIEVNLNHLNNVRTTKEKRAVFAKLFTIIEAVPKGDTGNLSTIIEYLLNSMSSTILQILKNPETTEDQDQLTERAVKFLKLVMRSIPEQFSKYLKSIFDVVL
jgi:hypothetical protein